MTYTVDSRELKHSIDDLMKKLPITLLLIKIYFIGLHTSINVLLNNRVSKFFYLTQLCMCLFKKSC